MRLQLVILLVAASQVGATDCGQAIKDPGFDLWCGDTLCAWTVERGAISKVPTWNEGDPGVSLDGNDVAIAQVSPVAASDGSCIQLNMIANVEANAQVAINFDIYDDGTVDNSQLIPTASWQPLSFIVDVAGNTWTGMRFEITKTGSGHAVLAQISASVLDPSQCVGFTPVVPVSIPIGAACGSDGDCGSGNTCQGGGSGILGVLLGECVGCTAGSAGDSCSAGQSCGLGTPVSPIQPIPTECVATASQPIGTPCLTDAECTSGICTANTCSACRADGEGCGSGVACGVGGWTATENVPWVCAPGKAAGTSGTACASDADCASGTCNGSERMQCDDGRACTTDDDCPFGGSDTANPLDNGPCQTVGIQGGSCQ